MLELKLEDNPIIFPKLTYLLGMRGVKISILGRKRADFRLSEYLYEGAVGTLIPDIAVYDLRSGEWIEYSSDEFWIEPKIGNRYYYRSKDIATNTNLSFYENYVLLHSSAMLKFTS